MAHLNLVAEYTEPEAGEGLDEDEIAKIVGAEIDAAVSYSSSELDANRTRAIEYYRGEMNDLGVEVGRSQVVDHTVQDVIGWILPGLMRVFFGADKMIVYEPKGPEDEQWAAQATDYVNHIVLKESNAYQVLWDASHDALLHGNGVVKHFWDKTAAVKTERLFNLDDNQLALVLSQPGVEVLLHTPKAAEVIETPEGPMPVQLHDVKIRLPVDGAGKVTLKAVPPENFKINREATEISNQTRFAGENFTKTRSELREMGLDPDVIDDLAAGTSAQFEGAALARRSEVSVPGIGGFDKSTEEIEIWETYPLIDVDGDGLSERLKVISTGPSGMKILHWELWDDDLPYSDLTPERIPHLWQGRSIFDDTEDMQRVRSVLFRQFMDNLYQANVPDRAVDQNRVRNPDALLERRLGNIIRTDGDPAGVIRDLAVPFVAQHALTGLQYTEEIIERRTGVSRSSMGLDPETLQNQSATAASIQQSAAYSKIELIARNFAELGLKRIGSCLLKLVVKYQDRPRTYRLRNQWVQTDPRSWNADMDVLINVGLGSGSRDRDMQMLNVVVQRQMELMQLCGGSRTQAGREYVQAVVNSLQKLVEAAGLKGPEQIFPELTEEHLQEITQASAPPDPAQVEAAKAAAVAQATLPVDLERMRIEDERQERDMQRKAQIEGAQAQADIATRQQETLFQQQLKAQDQAFQERMKMLDFYMQMALRGQAEPGTMAVDQVKNIVLQAGGQLSPELEQAMLPAMKPIDGVVARLDRMAEESRQNFQMLAEYIKAPVKVDRGADGKVTGGHKVLN